jgi:cytochrome c biogenesis protein CcmG/thiol:disulfide interchange protein DsbE
MISTKKNFVKIILLFITLILCYVFLRGFIGNSQILPSALINQSAPAFNVPELYHESKILNHDLFIGHISLLNVWASWCSNCMMEQPFLMDIAHKYHIKMIGLNYKDDRDSAKDFLQQFGNPFQQIGFDQSGDTAMNWGVYGVPETFVIDKKGVIRYKQIGPMTEDDWGNIILPLIKKLEKE